MVEHLFTVLTDPQARAIYDIYGKRGLDVEGWEVSHTSNSHLKLSEIAAYSVDAQLMFAWMHYSSESRGICHNGSAYC